MFDICTELKGRNYEGMRVPEINNLAWVKVQVIEDGRTWNGVFDCVIKYSVLRKCAFEDNPIPEFRRYLEFRRLQELRTRPLTEEPL